MKKIRLLFTNDLHSNIPDAITLLKILIHKKHNSVIVDTGDFSGGAPFYNLFAGNPEKRILNDLYDIVAPGNHGFLNLVELREENVIIFPCEHSLAYCEQKKKFILAFFVIILCF